MDQYCYRPEILEALHRHGINPGPATPPSLVREYLNDLYRFELRRLRDRLVGGQIPKQGYSDRVVELRRKYPLLSLKTEFWTAPQGAGQTGPPAD